MMLPEPKKCPCGQRDAAFLTVAAWNRHTNSLVHILWCSSTTTQAVANLSHITIRLGVWSLVDIVSGPRIGPENSTKSHAEPDQTTGDTFFV